MTQTDNAAEYTELLEGETSPDARAEERADEARLARIQALGAVLARKRDEAIQARIQSGIEDDWIEDDESYEGIDDANREIMRNKNSMVAEGGNKAEKVVRSRVFMNITRSYVDAAAAKVGDMLLPTDEPNFGIEPTPGNGAQASLGRGGGCGQWPWA